MWRRIAAYSLRLMLMAAAFYLFSGYEPLGVFTKHLPVPQTIFGISLLLLIFARRPLTVFLNKILMLPERMFVWPILAAWLIATLLAQHFVLETVPHVSDSVAYYFQAKMLAAGRFVQDSHPLYEFFSPHFYINDGRLFSLFQPGWPIFLALGFLIGLPWIIAPLMGTAMLLIIYRLAGLVFDERNARLSLLLAAVTPFSIFMSASFMAHTQSSLLGLAAFYILVEHHRAARTWHLPLAGLMWGLLFITRAYDAILMAPLMLMLLAPAAARGGMKWKSAALMALIGLIFVASQLGYNYALNGSALKFAQDTYFERTELKPDCHKLGFGKHIGCEAEHGQYSFPEGYYFSDAIEVTHHRMASLVLNLYGLPLVVVFILLPIILIRRNYPAWLLYAMSFVFIGGYMLFYYHGNCYGPRFYFAILGPLSILGAHGILESDRLMQLAAEKLRPVANVIGAIIPALALTMLIFCVFYLSPSLWKNYENFRGINGKLGRLVKENDIHNAVVVLPGMGTSYGYGFIYNDADFSGDVIYARQIMDSTAQLMYYYPEREFYRLRVYGTQLVKLEKERFEGVISIEMQAKVPAIETRGGIAYASYGKNKGFRGLTDGHQLYFRTQENGAYFKIRQYVFEEGDYLIEASATRAPNYGRWKLIVNNFVAGKEQDAYSPAKSLERQILIDKVHLKKGLNDFTFKVTGKNENSGGYGFGIDMMNLRRIPDGLNRPLPVVKDIGVFEHGEIKKY